MPFLKRKQSKKDKTTDKDSSIVAADNSTSQSKQNHLSSKKVKRLLAACAILLLLVAGFGVLVNRINESKKSVCSPQNKNGVFDLAKTAIAEDDINKQKETVEHITSLKGYETDPKCLNIVTTYYVNISDYEQAKSSFDALQQLTTSEDFKQTMGSEFYSMEQLQNQVKYLEEVSKNKNNQIILNVEDFE